MDLFVNKDNKYYQLTGLEPINKDYYTVSYIVDIRKSDLGSFNDPRLFCGIIDGFKVYGIETTFPDRKIYRISLDRGILQCYSVRKLVEAMLCFPNITIKGIYKKNKI